MKKTWRPMIAGTIDLVLGSFLFAGFAALAVVLIAARDSGTSTMAIASALVALLGAVTFAGGVLAILRKAWWFAVAGSSLPLAFAFLSYALSEILFAGRNTWEAFIALPGALIVYALEAVLPLAAVTLLVLSRHEFGDKVSVSRVEL